MTRRKRRPPLTAKTADPYDLYQRSVQNVEAEIDYVDRVFYRLRGRRAVLLREDFCGTANTACEWVRRRPTNLAVGLDLDPKPLAWGQAHTLSLLTDEQRSRIELVRGDVLDPPAPPAALRRALPRGASLAYDAVLAMNFSYWCFRDRDTMLGYFRAVRRSLGREGVFFLDFIGGSDTMKEITETTQIGGRRTGFLYVWDQRRYDPITGHMTCHIHFRFPDGSALRRAFTYYWRLWTLPELKELLDQAGFSQTTVYAEGDDGRGGGNGIFRPAQSAPADRAFIAYIVAEVA